MEPGVMLRVILILTGVGLFFATLSSLAKRRMTEPFCLTWGMVSVMIILAGFLLRPVEWNRYISVPGLFLVGILSFSLIFWAFFTSARVSELMRRNLELAMQVSLLNRENEEIRKELEELKAELKAEPGEKEKSGEGTL